MTVARVMSQIVARGIAAGGFHTCALRENGDAVCWGVEDPDDVPAGRFVAIHAGEAHTCALRDRGEVVCWGSNSDGQSDVPAGRFTAISAGSYRGRSSSRYSGHTCGLRENGEAVCWGDNLIGQATPPPATTFVRPSTE